MAYRVGKNIRIGRGRSVRKIKKSLGWRPYKRRIAMDVGFYYCPYLPKSLYDYKVVCDQSNNPLESIKQGRLNVDIEINCGLLGISS